MEKRACTHCHRLFSLSRNPAQSFCSERSCQNARKAHWRRTRLTEDVDYRTNQQDACKRWRRKNPSYWKRYRATHLDYTQHNRESQKQRNQGVRQPPGCNQPSLFANSDALRAPKPFKTGTYKLIPVPYGEVANSDALIVEISVITGGVGLMEDVCKHTTL